MSTLAQAIVRDLYANRPAASIPGRLFIASDSRRCYRDNGTSWDEVVLMTKLASQTIGATQATIAHGLGAIPSVVIITPRSNATFWESAVADATNVYITASAASQTADIYVMV